jgi:DNA-binding GntR family transcriptional regulator
MAARCAARGASEKHFELMRTSLKKQELCLANADVEGYWAAAMTFHQHVIHAARNKTLERVLGSVYAQMQAMRVHLKYFPTRLPDSFRDHETILCALVARDADLAERQARAHIQTLSTEIRRNTGQVVV